MWFGATLVTKQLLLNRHLTVKNTFDATAIAFLFAPKAPLLSPARDVAGI